MGTRPSLSLEEKGLLSRWLVRTHPKGGRWLEQARAQSFQIVPTGPQPPEAKVSDQAPETLGVRGCRESEEMGEESPFKTALWYSGFH